MKINNFFFISVSGLFFLHWVSAQFYHYYCAPPGLSGLVKSLINSPSPICISVNYLQFYSIKYYYSLWISFAIVFCKTLSENVVSMKNKLEKRSS